MSLPRPAAGRVGKKRKEEKRNERKRNERKNKRYKKEKEKEEKEEKEEEEGEEGEEKVNISQAGASLGASTPAWDGVGRIPVRSLLFEKVESDPRRRARVAVTADTVTFKRPAAGLKLREKIRPPKISAVRVGFL